MLQMIIDSGVFGYVIVGIAVIAVLIISERSYVLFKTYSINADSFMKKVQELIGKDQIGDAVTLCAKEDEKPLPHVIKAVLERSDRDDESIYQGMDIAMAEVIPKLGKRLNYLSLFANVATLFGLLGTIQGLIMSFAAVAQADAAQKNELLAQGISIAMYTTAMGLIVAIPSLVVYTFLHNKQSRMLEEIVEHAAKVVDTLTTRHYVAPQSSVAGGVPKKAPPVPRAS